VYAKDGSDEVKRHYLDQSETALSNFKRYMNFAHLPEEATVMVLRDGTVWTKKDVRRGDPYLFSPGTEVEVPVKSPPRPRTLRQLRNVRYSRAEKFLRQLSLPRERIPDSPPAEDESVASEDITVSEAGQPPVEKKQRVVSAHPPRHLKPSWKTFSGRLDEDVLQYLHEAFQQWSSLGYNDERTRAQALFSHLQGRAQRVVQNAGGWETLSYEDMSKVLIGEFNSEQSNT
jgi:hypothetical protein